MSAAKLKSKPKAVAIRSVGTTVWGGSEMPIAKAAPVKKLAQGKKSPIEKPSGSVTVTVFDTPLRPRHTTRAILAAAARSVK